MRPSAPRFGFRLLPLLLVAGCASEVRREDDDGTGGAAADVATVGTGVATTSSSTSTSASSGTGAFDLEASCKASCQGECVAGPMSCIDACFKAWEEVKPWCGPAWEAAFACGLHGCVPGHECNVEQEALSDCQIVYCQDFACTATAEGCHCAASSCEEGHTRRAECRRDASGSQIDCDCYENDVLVLACVDDLDGCYENGHLNCCDDLLRSGYY